MGRKKMTGKVPEIVRWSFASMQVCVPEDYDDETITEFANRNHPTGITSKWSIRTDGPDPVRVTCATRRGCVHVVLEC